MDHITRRDFLKKSAGTALFLGSSPLLTGCKREDDILGQDAGETSVSIIRGENLQAMTCDAIDAIGGMESIVHEGENVFIKPNFVTFPWAETNDCFNRGECTKPEIIIAVAEECLRAGAREVIIGDGSHLPSFEWRNARTLDESTDLVSEANRLNSIYDGNISMACLENDSPEWVEVPSNTYLERIAISSLVAHADRVISIPVAKTHSWAQLTLGLKNFIGITPQHRYAQWVNGYWDRGKEFDHSSPQSIAAIYLDIVKAIKPDLTVVDFSIGIEGRGPTTGSGGITVDMKDRLGSWLVLAGRDIVATDTTTARIMNHNISNQVQLQMAYQLGLGQINPGSIEIIGEKVEDVRVGWQPAPLAKPKSSGQCPGYLS